MGKYLLILLIVVLGVCFGELSYSDSVMLSGYMENATRDINETARDVIARESHVEKNPLVKPMTDNLTAGQFSLLGFAGMTYLSVRWSRQPSSREIFIAQLIEAYANYFNGSEFVVRYGVLI